MIAYRDATTVDNDVVYTVTPLVGEGEGRVGGTSRLKHQLRGVGAPCSKE